MTPYNTMMLAVMRAGGRFSPKLGWTVVGKRFATLELAYAFVTRRT